uniref:Uncharacterized protein n=1 Tax=Sinocyclocheilus rhinocerous TaxID=307959 RepID=A0A673GRM6_9TELE
MMSGNSGCNLLFNSVPEHYNPNLLLCAVRFTEDSFHNMREYRAKKSFVERRSKGRGSTETPSKLFVNHNALGQLTNHNTFCFSEGGPSSKPELIELKADSCVQFSDMMFFDDEDRNIVEVCRLGVHCVVVHNAITWALVKKALEQFSK